MWKYQEFLSSSEALGLSKGSKWKFDKDEG